MRAAGDEREPGRDGGGEPRAGRDSSRYATAPLVALGLLAATACLTERRRAPGAVQHRLAEVGRAALSCYVLQNLASSALCYGWGLGLAARIDDARTWWTPVIYAAVCAIVVTFAHLWMRRFARGPLEAAWTWAYRRPPSARVAATMINLLDGRVCPIRIPRGVEGRAVARDRGEVLIGGRREPAQADGEQVQPLLGPRCRGEARRPPRVGAQR